MKSKRLFVIAGFVAAMLLAIPVLASARDGNKDRIPDSWEKSNHLSLNVNQARRDQDHDGLPNRGEFRRGTDPRDADTDNDGTEDGAECVGEHSSGVDSDDDGVNDENEAECEVHQNPGPGGNEPGDDHGSGGHGADDGPNHT